MAKKKVQSIEPNIADLANGWLKSYKRDYKLGQESMNTEIDKALHDYFSKNGGNGANRPYAKLLLKDSELNYYPILIEYKGRINWLNLTHLIKLRTKLLRTSLTSNTSIPMQSNGKVISFTMKSNEFKTLVQTGKVLFKNGSSINCHLITHKNKCRGKSTYIWL